MEAPALLLCIPQSVGSDHAEKELAGVYVCFLFRNNCMLRLEQHEVDFEASFGIS